jgi:hypothetical protein
MALVEKLFSRGTPDSVHEADELIRSGRLSVRKGRVQEITVEEDALLMATDCGSIKAEICINCSGPAATRQNIVRKQHQSTCLKNDSALLLDNLIRQGLIGTHPVTGEIAMQSSTPVTADPRISLIVLGVLHRPLREGQSAATLFFPDYNTVALQNLVKAAYA